MSESPREDGGSAVEDEANQEEAYYLWASAELRHLLGLEDERHRHLQRKATMAAGFVLALASFLLPGLRGPDSWTLAEVILTSSVALGVLMTVTLAFVVHRIRPHPTVAATIFTREDVLGQRPYRLRYESVVAHQRDTLVVARDTLTGMSLSAKRTQDVALATGVLMIVLAVFLGRVENGPHEQQRQERSGAETPGSGSE